MTDEILHKLKKALKIFFLLVIGLVFFFIAIVSYFFAMNRNVTGQKTSLSRSSGISSMVALPSLVPLSNDEEQVHDYQSSPGSSSGVANPKDTIFERKLTQNGALSLAVDRVEDAVTNLVDIAEKLGGRIDSANIDNRGDAMNKRATVIMRVPAVNFSMAMEQAKKIGRKVQYENISTEDVTEQFIDMQARLKNLKAEETQYIEIMQKAINIRDVLQISQRLYSVREQIEQLQGQMNYLSRQVDMSIITVELSSEPDIEATNVIWNPKTVAKEAVQGLIKGLYGFFTVVIYLAIFILPLVILWVAIIILIVWLVWKLLLNIKKRLHKP